jgi:alpha-1,6-mannosyltransferase
MSDTDPAAAASRPASILRSPTAMAGIGLAGSLLVALASYWVAAIPIFFRRPDTPVISFVGLRSPLPRAVFYVGLTAMLLAWLQLGRLVLDGAPGTDWRRLRRVALAWVAPMVATMPFGSRDLWAYAAQGQLVRHGLDPYTLGPSALPGSFAEEVSHRWVETPAPYGPLWLTLGRVVATGVSNVWVTVMVLRLLAVAGFLLLAWALPIMAKRAGGRPDVAVWVGLANPLMIVLGVGGGHNDLLMVGLMAAALVIATGPGSWWRTLGGATIVATAAIAIKSPAVVVLAFLVPLWLHHAPSAARWRNRRAITLATVFVASTAIALFAGFTQLSGLGWGWIKLVNSAAPIVNWMSLPSLLAICWNLLLGITHGTTRVNATMRAFRDAGTVLSLLILVLAWFDALRRRWWELLALALFVVVVLGPTVQPWYFCWVLAVAAAFATSRTWSCWLAGASIALVVMIRPNGTGLQMKPVVLAIMAGAGLLSWAVLVSHERRRRPSATHQVSVSSTSAKPNSRSSTGS